MDESIAWTKTAIEKLFELPFLTLIYQAQTIHQHYFDPNEIELCTLLNIKTGGCPENCAYCPQSGHYDTGIGREKLTSPDQIVEKAKQAKNSGATRFCMGAAWRSPPTSDFPKLLDIIKAVNALGLETCLTAGMVTDQQARALKAVDLDYYNHNLDTSSTFYEKIITTHTYKDRLKTLAAISDAGINICCGGIMGLGEEQNDRIELLLQLTQLKKPPASVPINRLIPIKGTPLADQIAIDNVDFIRMIAVTRIVLPKSMIRLSAGRIDMSEEMQILCFMAGANSIHFGEKLLMTPNTEQNKDLAMLKRLGLRPKPLRGKEKRC